MSRLMRYAMTIVGLLLLILAGTAAPAEASFPGGQGRIAFDGPRGGIYSIRPDGSGLVQLTSGLTDYFPRWSPDGRTIAFQRGFPAQIWLMSADGIGQHPLTAGPVARYSPDWSPDGSRIVYAQTVAPYTSQLYTISSRGGPATRLLTDADNDGEPKWSPDGQSIVFRSDGPQGTEQIKLLDLRSGTVRVLLNSADQPDWSPDGSQIVATVGALGGLNLASIRPDGTGYHLTTRFVFLTGALGPQAHAGVWSPSGPPSLAITFQGTLGPWQIATIGTGMHILAFGSNPDWQPTT